MNWFDVDKAGLAKLLERKGKPFVVLELIQNAWDENTTEVLVQIRRMGSTPYVRIEVRDDNPTGFADLTHAFTLFAESAKGGNAEKRGRFNLGEKLVLAMCRKAEIFSTKGTVIFDENGRRQSKRNATLRGSIFSGELRMTDAEIEECRDALLLLLPPHGIKTRYDIGGEEGELFPKITAAEFETTLPTEIADNEGNMRRTQRKTRIEIYAANGQAYLYEMGIPVVEIDGRFQVNVMQKVPLNFDRDNVSPAYLAKVHALTAENVTGRLTEEDASASWIKIGMEEQPDLLSDDTVRKIADLRFGEKRVAYDPSDPEANNLAVAQGYNVIHGGSLSAGEWSVLRRAEAILPAGRVTPSPRPFSPEGQPLSFIPTSQWTQPMQRVALYAQGLALRLLGSDLKVQITNDRAWNFAAAYGKGHLILSHAKLGKNWFSGPLVKINALLIHEFGHHYSGNHLSEAYHDALCDLGARLAQWVMEDPAVFAEYEQVLVSEAV